MEVEFDQRKLGQRINQYRKDAKLSQEKLAELVGVSQQHLSNIINGHVGIGMNALLKIAVALNADLNYLLGLDTAAGNRALDEQFAKLLASLSMPEKEQCFAICQAYVENRPTDCRTVKEVT